MVFLGIGIVCQAVPKSPTESRKRHYEDGADIFIRSLHSDWKVASTMSLFTTGSGDTWGNYRPFSFDSIVGGKVLGSILGD